MENKNNFLVPIAILIAGALITWGVISNDSKPTPNNNPTNTNVETNTKPAKIMPVTKEDHILGDPNAELILIEYSDLECPFCKRFYNTTKKLMEDYGKDGKLAIVFRHFPLDQLHSQSRTEAIATECAAELGGNTKFWEYTDNLLSITPSNNGLDLKQLPIIAKKIGLDVTKFTECQKDPEMAKRVKKDFQDGIVAGVKGTPYSLIIEKDGTQTVVSGAQPYNIVKSTIDKLLAK